MSVASSTCDVLHEYGIPRRGVVHIGAHRAQELKRYQKCGFQRTLWIEPNPVLAAALRQRGLDVVECAVLNRSGTASLYVTVWDEQSSVLRPLHYPVKRVIEVKCQPLSAIDVSGCNVAVIDVQGAELDVLRSIEDTSWLDALVVETNRVKRYARWDPPESIVEWCSEHGYRAVLSLPHGATGLIVDYVFVRESFMKAALACV